MAASPITDELGALEQARSQLEAALADDENWRALGAARTVCRRPERGTDRGSWVGGGAGAQGPGPQRAANSRTAKRGREREGFRLARATN